MRPLTYRGEFGKWLRNKLIESNLTERELAIILNIHYVTISYHLNAQRKPTMRMLEKYADFFGVDKWELYEMTLGGDL